MLALLIALIAPPADAYPRPELLADPAAVAGGKAVVIDVRAAKEYAAGHAPGAVRADPKEWMTAFGQGTDAAGWSARIGAFGVTADTPVVVYDDAKSKDSARAWWILKYWGVKDVKVLNGGWRGWTAGKHPVSTDAVTPTPAPFKAVAQAARHATKADVLYSLTTGTPQILDCRTADEHTGKTLYENKRGGAIPGAKHLDWADMVDPATHRFLPAAELAAKFKAAGISLAKPTTTHCQLGGRSSVGAFVLELMGADGVRNYHAGFAEWAAAAGTPVEKK